MTKFSRLRRVKSAAGDFLALAFYKVWFYLSKARRRRFFLVGLFGGFSKGFRGKNRPAEAPGKCMTTLRVRNLPDWTPARNKGGSYSPNIPDTAESPQS